MSIFFTAKTKMVHLRGGLRRGGVARVRVTAVTAATGHTLTTGKRSQATVTQATEEETNTTAVAPPSGQSRNPGLVNTFFSVRHIDF